MPYGWHRVLVVDTLNSRLSEWDYTTGQWLRDVVTKDGGIGTPQAVSEIGHHLWVNYYDDKYKAFVKRFVYC